VGGRAAAVVPIGNRLSGGMGWQRQPGRDERAAGCGAVDGEHSSERVHGVCNSNKTVAVGVGAAVPAARRRREGRVGRDGAPRRTAWRAARAVRRGSDAVHVGDRRGCHGDSFVAFSGETRQLTRDAGELSRRPRVGARWRGRGRRRPRRFRRRRGGRRSRLRCNRRSSGRRRPRDPGTSRAGPRWRRPARASSGARAA
jgi:hypothetical protein